MTTLLLIRHAETGASGLLTGWMGGWHLNSAGQIQAQRLAERLSGLPIRAVYASPLERTLETAEIVAAPHGLAPECLEDLGEVDFGEWEGYAFEDLQNDERWRQYNLCRTCTQPPGGEWITEVQTRMARGLNCLAERHPEEIIAVVSHGDPLRCAVAHFLGMPVDFISRFEITPASVTVVEIAPWGPRVLCLNENGEIACLFK